MGTMLSALLHLQSIERQLAHVRGRLKTRKNAVIAQQKRIEQLQGEWQALNDRKLQCRKDADSRELDLKDKEGQVQKFRSALNLAKTNKEYAALLTQINTLKADNAKLEEQVLKIIQEVDVIAAQADQVSQHIENEKKRLAEIQASSDEEIAKLTAMTEDLAAQRAQAAKSVPRDALNVFERIAGSYDGDAMAPIEVHGRKPPHEYICGGCFMSLNAEHANALRVKDEIRTCDNCGRILYLEPKAEETPTR